MLDDGSPFDQEVPVHTEVVDVAGPFEVHHRPALGLTDYDRHPRLIIDLRVAVPELVPNMHILRFLGRMAVDRPEFLPLLLLHNRQKNQLL